MYGSRSLGARWAVALSALVLAVGVVGTLRAQEGPAAERILENSDVVQFFTPASGALFALRSAFIASPTAETLLRSDDGGATWRPVDLPPRPTGDYERRAVAVHPLDHSVLFATGAEGLYKSDDDAASWRLVLAGLNGRVLIAPSGADGGLVYASAAPSGEASSPHRVVRSRDGGESWEEMFAAPCRSVQLFPDPTDPAGVIAAFDCGSELPAALYVSRDQGATWSASGPWPAGESGGSPTLALPLVLGGGGVQPERFYAAFTFHSPEAGIPLFRSDDAGGSWREQIVGSREEVAPASPKWQGGKFWSYVSALDYDPQAPDRVYVGMRGSPQPLRTSADGGATWAALTLPSNLRNVTAVALGVDGQNLYVATASGTYAYGTEGVYRVRLSGP